MTKGYFVNLEFNSGWEVEATNAKEAEVNGRQLLAQLILDGTIAIKVTEREY